MTNRVLDCARITDLGGPARTQNADSEAMYLIATGSPELGDRADRSLAGTLAGGH